MASIMLEVVEHEFPETDVEVLPGVTAATAAASRLGSSLSGNYVTLRLSDLLMPWETIEKRLHLAFQMGVPVALYNPKSRGRPLNLGKAIGIALQYRSPDTLVGVVRNVFRDSEETFCVMLASLGENDELVDMHSILIIGGNETRFWEDNGDIKGIITPQGYHRKYVFDICADTPEGFSISSRSRSLAREMVGTTTVIFLSTGHIDAVGDWAMADLLRFENDPGFLRVLLRLRQVPRFLWISAWF